MTKILEKATFGAGCFWQVEVEFRNTPGVTDAIAGYSGGMLANPTYEKVCRGNTGHAEVVQVTFDPGEVSYGELVEKFWSLHDPTQVNRQGLDFGEQYRTAIFTHSPGQEKAAIASRDELQLEMKRPIATEITSVSNFYPAEDYHQRYLEKRGMASCRT